MLAQIGDMTTQKSNFTEAPKKAFRYAGYGAQDDPFRQLLWAVLIQAAEDAADSRNLDLALSARQWLAEHGAAWLEALGSELGGELEIWIRRDCAGGHKLRHIARRRNDRSRSK